MQVKLQARRSLCDRGVAQFGSALGSGPRGRGFKSRHLDHVAARQFSQQSRRFPALFAFMPATPFSQKVLRAIAFAAPRRVTFWEPYYFPQVATRNRAGSNLPCLFLFTQESDVQGASLVFCPLPHAKAEKAAFVLFCGAGEKRKPLYGAARPGQRVKSSYKSETSAAVSASPTMRSSASTPVGSPNRASSPVAPAHSALQLVPAKLAYRSSSCAS